MRLLRPASIAGARLRSDCPSPRDWRARLPLRELFERGKVGV